jgi:hypothetical protein
MIRTLYLGLGAQKAGTSWLFRQLIESEKFSPGLCKEYHLFDYLHLDRLEFRARIGQRINNYKEGDPTLNKDQKLELFDSFYEDTDNYYNYLDHLLKEDGSFTTDITPAYANLDAGVLENIKKELNRRNIRVKVIFIMREPVCRLESQIRMKKRRDKTIGETSVNEMVREMNSSIKNHGFKSEGNYSFTVDQIDKVFSEDEALLTFYEEMFTVTGMQKLSDFFEVPISTFQPKKRFNMSPKVCLYSIDQLEQWRGNFDNQYEFVQSRFNFDTEKWRNSLIEELAIESQKRKFPGFDLLRKI